MARRFSAIPATHLDFGFGTVLTENTDLLRIFIRNLHVLPYSPKKRTLYIASHPYLRDRRFFCHPDFSFFFFIIENREKKF